MEQRANRAQDAGPTARADFAINAGIYFVGQPSSGKTSLLQTLFGPGLNSARMRSEAGHTFHVCGLGYNLVCVDTGSTFGFQASTPNSEDVELLRDFAQETFYEPLVFIFSWRFTHFESFPTSKVLALHEMFPKARILVTLTFSNCASLPQWPASGEEQASKPARESHLSPRKVRWQTCRTRFLQKLRQDVGGLPTLSWLSTSCIDNDPLCKRNSLNSRCLLNGHPWVSSFVGLVVAACKDCHCPALRDTFAHSPDPEVVAAARLYLSRRLRNHPSSPAASDQPSAAGPSRIGAGTIGTVAFLGAGAAALAAAPALVVGSSVVAVGAFVYKGVTSLRG